MQLEVYEAGPDGQRTNDPFPICTFLKDDKEQTWVEVYTAAGPMRVPLKDIQIAIAQAKKDVRSEDSYDR